MMVYIGLGSNEGDRKYYLKSASDKLSRQAGINLLRTSRIIETKPYGVKDQKDFLNQVVEIETVLTPRELLVICQEIERQLNRKRLRKWGPRTIDLDILFYGNEVIKEDDLRVPHPDLENRLFVLESLNEIIPELVHPILDKTVKEIYQKIKQD